MDSISRKNWIISSILLYNLKWKKFFGNGLWSNFGTWDLKSDFSGQKNERTWFFVPIEFQLLWSEEANVSLSLSLSLALYSKRLTRYLASGKQKLLYFPLVLLDFEIRYFRLTSDLICIIISLIIYHIGHTGWFIGSGEIWLGNWIVCKLSIENKSWHKRQTFLNDCWCNQCAWWYCKFRAYCLPKIRGFRCPHLLSIVIVSFVRLEGKKNFVFLSFTRSFIHSLIRIWLLGN